MTVKKGPTVALFFIFLFYISGEGLPHNGGNKHNEYIFYMQQKVIKTPEHVNMHIK